MIAVRAEGASFEVKQSMSAKKSWQTWHTWQTSEPFAHVGQKLLADTAHTAHTADMAEKQKPALFRPQHHRFRASEVLRGIWPDPSEYLRVTGFRTNFSACRFALS